MRNNWGEVNNNKIYNYMQNILGNLQRERGKGRDKKLSLRKRKKKERKKKGNGY